MPFGPDIAILLVAVAGFVMLLVIWVALRNWVFELSPNEWLYTLVIAFSLGVFAASYLDGDTVLLLLSLIPIFLAVVWWVARLVHRHNVRSARAAEG